MKVSIIMPMYNTVEYVEKAIESVINQSYTDWELIIVDDHSTDGSYELAKKYENDKIKIIQNDTNVGCYISLNEGLLVSTGNYITRLDSDDTFHKDKLFMQVNVLDNNPNIMACGHRFSRNGNVSTSREITLMYRREVIDKIGYYDSVRFAADSEFYSRLNRVFGMRRIKLLPRILYFATVRNNSLTRSPSTRQRPIRNMYVKRYTNWHKKNLPYMAYPLIERPFPVDNIMLS